MSDYGSDSMSEENVSEDGSVDETPDANLEDPRLFEFVASAFEGSEEADQLSAIDLLGEAFGETESTGEQLDEYVKACLKICFAIVPRWRDPTIIKKLTQLLRSICASCSEARGSSARALLAKGVVKLATGSDPATPLAASTLLSWSCIVCPKLQGKMLENQVKCQFQCLQRIQTPVWKGSAEAIRRWEEAVQAVGKMLISGAVAGAYQALLFGELKDTKVKISFAALGVLLQHLAKKGKLQDSKAELATFYCDRVLMAKSRFESPAGYQCFDGLLASLSAEELESLIVPSINRGLKRGPQIVPLPLARLANVATCDICRLAITVLIPAAIELVMDADDDDARCLAAIQLSAAAGRQCTTAEAVGKTWVLVKDALQGKTTPSQRSSILAIALAVIDTPICDNGASTVALDAANTLIAMVRDEKDGLTKAKYFGPLGHWLSRLDTFPPAFVAIGTRMLQAAKGEGVRRGILQALLQATASDELVQQGQPFVDGVFETLRACANEKTSIASARAREGIAAARVLITLATADPGVDKALEEGGFWPLVLSPVQNLGFWRAVESLPLKTDSPELLMEICLLFSELLRDHPHRVPFDEESLSLPMFDALTGLLIHDDKSVRAIATDSTGALLQSNPALSHHMLPSFTKFLNGLGDAWMGDDGERSLRLQITSAVLHVTKLLPITDATDFLLMAHHPLLVTSDRLSPWSAFMNRFLPRDNPPAAHTQAFKNQLGTMVAVLHSSSGLSSEHESWREAAINAIGSLSAWDIETTAAEMMPAVTANLDPSQLQALSDYDLQIFMNSSGELADKELAQQQEALCDITITATTRKKTGGPAKMTAFAERRLKEKGLTGYTAQDEAWEAELRAELEAKKVAEEARAKGGRGGGKGRGRGRGGGKGGRGGPDKSKPMSAKEMIELKVGEKLAEEQARREELMVLCDKFERNGSVLSAMISANPHGAQEIVSDVLPVLISMMAAGLSPVATAASELMKVVVAAAADDPAHVYLAPLAESVVNVIALQQCHPFLKESFSQKSTLKQSLNYLLNEITGPRGCQGVPLPPAAFICVFPAVIAALSGAAYEDKSSKEAMTLHAPVLSFLALHTAVGVSYPRVDMLRLLLQTVLLQAQGTLHNLAIGTVGKLFAGVGTEDMLDATESLLSQHSHVRAACLQGLRAAPALPSLGSGLVQKRIMARIVFACESGDGGDDDAMEAETVRELCGAEISPDYATEFADLLCGSPNAFVRETAAKCFAAAVDIYPETAQATLDHLMTLYSESADTPFGEPMEAKFVLKNEEGELFPWNCRVAIALAIKAVSPFISQSGVSNVIEFLVSRPIGDLHDDVKNAMVQTALKIVDDHGETCANLIFPVLEGYLAASDFTEPEDLKIQDRARESVVICLGGLAKHLPPEGGKPIEIMDRLLVALNTPSEPVQRSISTCLPGLIKVQKDRAEELLGLVLNTLQTSQEYAPRRGAAFGLAGLVKGLGLSSLKQHQVIPKLSDLVDPAVNKKNNFARQGGLWAFECLCVTLGRLFEPYVIHILPLLLTCFNAGEQIRDAASGAADAIMAQLSGQGVKLVLPALLKAVDESDAWRTKQGAIDVLGAMANCAPRQLSQCLPTVVPRLCETLTDTHPKVQAAARGSLEKIGAVIRNPEIKGIATILLNALADPQTHTKEALQKLMDMAFVHAVDAPSLAIIMPILQRGLRDRSTETKKRGCQIVGSMCSLIASASDMEAYLPMVLPELKMMLMDGVPEVRAVAAKALGSLVLGMGEKSFPTLINDLLDKACPPPGEIDQYGDEERIQTTTVERAGAAQGLSEVICGVGLDRFSTLMPELLDRYDDPRPEVREGVLSIFVYMPQACGTPEEFLPYIADTLPPVLSGLADEGEAVRDIGLRAAKVLVEIYGRSSLDLLLPPLMMRLFDDDWRIRHSAVQLLGDLLFKLTGASGKAVMDDDDVGVATVSAQQALVDALGQTRRNQLLGNLYMLRTDVSHVVGHAANHVWKSIVVNPPKTLKEVMEEMMTSIVEHMASENEDHRVTAGRAMGDLVHKMGESVLPMILPFLQEGIQDEDPVRRQGICLGLAEVISSASKTMIEMFVEDFIPPIKSALSDGDEAVREAAAKAFSTMYRQPEFGRRALDEVVPGLLSEIDEGNTAALDGLRQVVTVKPQLVQSLVPKFVGTGVVSMAAAQCLAAIADIDGVSLGMYLNSIVPALLEAVQRSKTIADKDEMIKLSESVIVAVADQLDGEMDDMVLELVRGLKATAQYTPPPAMRQAAAALVQAIYVANLEMETENHIDLYEELMKLLNCSEQETRLAAWNAIDAMVGAMDKEELPQLIPSLRLTIKKMREDGLRENETTEWFLLGLSVPKGMKPFTAVLQQGLMHGTVDVREQSASGLGELIEVTEQKALQAFVVQITGPLIRIVGDRFPSEVWHYFTKTRCHII
jgi:HEAT repeat protein